MASNNRAGRIAALQKVARKQYQPVSPPARSVLEHLLFACCLEDAPFDAADIAFARLQQSFIDWNEIRVTTTIELAEVMSSLPDAAVSAARLKRTLHSMFESHYTFDIDPLRKENLGKAVQRIEKYKGISPFVVGYVAQNALGGHSIAIDRAMINLLYTVGVIDEKEAAKNQAPGLERAIPKSKAVEFFSTVHQLAVAWLHGPFNKDLRDLLLTIDPDAQSRFPKRARPTRPEPVKEKPEPAAAVKAPPAEAIKAKPGKEEKKTVAAKGKEPAPAAKPSPVTSKTKKHAAAPPASKKKVVEKKPAAAPGRKPPVGKKKPVPRPAAKPPNKNQKLARKKPR
jgi:hypothetical protein